MSGDKDLSSDNTENGEESGASEGSTDRSNSKEFSNDSEYESNVHVRSSYYGEVEFKKYTIESKILRKVIKALKSIHGVDNTESYFTQGEINSDDVSLRVTGIGNITFPIKYETASKLTSIATLASFGHGEETKKDQNVRDTYMIPKEKLNVTIKNLDNTLKDIKIKLSLNDDSNLEAHLHNMLIYKQGQHFDFHQDTEKMNNMVATLVVSLPSAHIGGDLVIKHLTKTHVFSTETIYGDHCKYIAFYSDCQHKVEKVKEGFRIVLTYNLILCGSQFKPNISCNGKLTSVLRKYFKNEQEDYGNKKLIYLFNHCYTQKAMKFSNLKGFDLQAASALVSTAKELNLVVRLALADIQEVWDGEGGDLVDMDVKLESWRSENNQPLEYKTYNASPQDICWMKHNNTLKPYDVENSGYTGNEGITEERRYKRAAIILWPQSSDLAMQFELNYDGELNKLKTLIESPKHLKSVQKIVNKAGEKLFLGLNSYSNDKELIESFVKLAIYIEDSKKALEMCQRFSFDLFDCENSNLFFKLKDVYGLSWCRQFMNESGISRKTYSSRLVRFTTVLKEIDRTMIEQILSDQIANAEKGYCKNGHYDRYGTLVRAAYETECFDHLKDIFKAVVAREWDVQKLAQFYIQYCLNIQKDITKSFEESVVTLLQENISRYRENYNKQLQWLSEVNFGNCKCELCRDMVQFLTKEGKVKEFAVNKQKRQHLLSSFEKQNKGSFSMTIKQSGSPHRLIVEKKIDVISDVEGKLTKMEKQLKNITEADAGDDKTFESKLVKRSTQIDDTKTLTKKQRL